jgi:hypothetical protein
MTNLNKSSKRGLIFFLSILFFVFLFSLLTGLFQKVVKSKTNLSSHIVKNEENRGSYASINKTVFRILPGPDNPRNSEGDFITLKNGRILYIYSHFTGTSGQDNANAFLAGRFSDDGGNTWSKEDITIVKQEGIMNVMSVSLLRLQNGEIALFYLKINSESDCIPMIRISTDETLSWSDPQPCITGRNGYFVLNNDRVIQLQNRRLIFAVAFHRSIRDNVGCLLSFYSDDNGRNWKSGQEVSNPDSVITQEPGLIELKDGNILMYIRTDKGVQYVSYSKDKGETWSSIVPSNIKSPLSPAAIARIPSTRDLLLAWNNNGINQKRTPLCIAISKDEGITWENIKIIEDDPEGSFCYTAIHFNDRNVLLGYWNRANKHNSSSDIARLSLDWIYK